MAELFALKQRGNVLSHAGGTETALKPKSPPNHDETHHEWKRERVEKNPPQLQRQLFERKSLRPTQLPELEVKDSAVEVINEIAVERETRTLVRGSKFHFLACYVPNDGAEQLI